MLHSYDSDKALVFNSSTGQLVRSFHITDIDSCMPVWHPRNPSLAVFVEGRLIVCNVKDGQSQEVARTPVRRLASTRSCQLHCWSPCGTLLCYSFQSGSEERRMCVVQANGCGTAFEVQGSSVCFRDARLSNASTGLLSVWGGHCLEVYDTSKGSLIFKNHALEKMADNDVCSMTDFLFGGSIAICVLADPAINISDDMARHISTDLYSDAYEDEVIHQLLYPDQVVLIDLQSQAVPAKAIAVCGDWSSEISGCFGVVSKLAACSPLGDRMLLRKRVRIEDGTLQRCVQLIKF